MPRTKGARNYQKEILYSVVKEVLPTGHFAWEQVAALYKEKSKEVELRDVGDVRRHWKDKLCNGFKKPTGHSGGACDFTLKCQQVQRLIHNSMEAKLIGASSLNGDEDYSSSDDEVVPNFQEDEMPWLDEGENQEPKESDVIASPTTHEEAEQLDDPPSPTGYTAPVHLPPATCTINKSSAVKTTVPTTDVLMLVNPLNICVIQLQKALMHCFHLLIAQVPVMGCLNL
ncbi:MAG: hypothetical protein RL463_856 [Bacteroidota bacterium]